MTAALTALKPAWTLADPSGQELWFNSTDVSEDGGVFVTGTFKFDTTADFTLFVVDRQGHERLRDVWAGSDMGVFWTAVSRDGRYAGGGGWLHASSARGYIGQMKLWDLQTKQPVIQQQTGSRVNHIAMTPAGEWVAASCGQVYSGSGQLVYLWMRQADGTFKALSGFLENGLSALSASFSEDGQWLVVAFIGPTHLILFRVTPTGLVEAKRWSIPQSQGLAAETTEDPDPRKYLAEHLRFASEKASYSGPYVKSVSMAPDGSRFAAAASGKNGVFLFDRGTFLQTGKSLWQKAPLGVTTTSIVTLSRDGRFLVAAGNGTGSQPGIAYRVDDSAGGPTLTWCHSVSAYGANPCNRLMDDAGEFVAFGTGQPQGSALSPGQLFVLKAASGEILSQMDTPVMNWPLQLSGDGSCAFGGSDCCTAFAFEAQGNWA